MMDRKYIKVGGSLMNSLTQLSSLLKKLVEVFGPGVVLNVGSGRLGDNYKRWIYKENSSEFSRKVTLENWSIVQMINSNIICSLNSDYVLCFSEEEVEHAHLNGKVAVLNPMAFHRELNDLDIFTCDLKAVYLSHKFCCRKLFIFTDVDGLYTEDPKIDSSARKIRSIKASALKYLTSKCLDDKIEIYLKKYQCGCHIIGVSEFLSSKNLRYDSGLEKLGTIVSCD